MTYKDNLKAELESRSCPEYNAKVQANTVYWDNSLPFERNAPEEPEEPEESEE